MISKLTISLLATTLLASGTAYAQSNPVFKRIASFPVVENEPDGADFEATSSEIIAASEDGMMIVYSDSPAGGIGLVDISDAANPQAAGFISLEDGEPTAVSVAGSKILAGVNTSASFTEPSGHLAVIDMETQEIEATCDLGGQPDSTAVSPDRSLLAIAIENERDEDLNDGEIPQLPAGYVAIFPLENGVPDCDAMMQVDLTGLADVAPSDPEPEFVDFNEANELAVTLQENNHIVVINGTDGTVMADFSAGVVSLEGIDTVEDGALIFDDAQADVPREPDALQWLDNDRFAIANEGDYNGGSRGFTVMSDAGEVLFEAGATFEYELIEAGHYPEGRSDAKGIEPEGMEVGTFGDQQYIFVMSERGSAVGIYSVTDGDPEFAQLIPSGVGPESAVAIPERNLLVTANEEDFGEDGGARAHVMIYEMGEGNAAYPTITSSMDESGMPLGWGAMSGLAAGEEAGELYAVNDSFYSAQPTIFTIDASQTPAAITGAIRVTRDGEPAMNMDMEGIVADGEGGFWVANEGHADEGRPHALFHIDADGAIQREVMMPEALLEGATNSGAEGVNMIDGVLWVAIQREWGDDPEGMVKLLSYNPESEEWGAVHYPLEAPAEEGWVGLSEITLSGDNVYIVERDNQIGQAAALKKLYRVAVSDLQPAEIGGELPVVTKEEAHDFIPDLQSFNGYVVDKVEGFAVDAAGEAFAITDNDGVDDSSGETFFWSIGNMQQM